MSAVARRAPSVRHVHAQKRHGRAHETTPPPENGMPIPASWIPGGSIRPGDSVGDLKPARHIVSSNPNPHNNCSCEDPAVMSDSCGSNQISTRKFAEKWTAELFLRTAQGE